MNKLLGFFNKIKNKILPSDTVQNLRNNGTCMAISTTSHRILPDPRSISHPQVDDVVSEDEVMGNNKERDIKPAESEKIEEAGELIMDIEQPSKMTNANDLCHDKGKDVEAPLTNQNAQDTSLIPILDEEKGKGWHVQKVYGNIEIVISECTII